MKGLAFADMAKEAGLPKKTRVQTARSGRGHRIQLLDGMQVP